MGKFNLGDKVVLWFGNYKPSKESNKLFYGRIVSITNKKELEGFPIIGIFYLPKIGFKHFNFTEDGQGIYFAKIELVTDENNEGKNMNEDLMYFECVMKRPESDDLRVVVVAGENPRDAYDNYIKEFGNEAATLVGFNLIGTCDTEHG